MPCLSIFPIFKKLLFCSHFTCHFSFEFFFSSFIFCRSCCCCQCHDRHVNNTTRSIVYRDCKRAQSGLFWNSERFSFLATSTGFPNWYGILGVYSHSWYFWMIKWIPRCSRSRRKPIDRIKKSFSFCFLTVSFFIYSSRFFLANQLLHSMYFEYNYGEPRKTWDKLTRWVFGIWIKVYKYR